MTTEDLIKNIEAAGFKVEDDRGLTYVNNVTTQEEYDKLENIVREAIGDDFIIYYQHLKAELICKRIHPWYYFRSIYQGSGFTPFEFEMLDDMDVLHKYNWGTAEQYLEEFEESIRDFGEDEVSEYRTFIEWLKTKDPNTIVVCFGDAKYSDAYVEVDGCFEDDGYNYFIGYIIPEVEDYDDEDE